MPNGYSPKPTLLEHFKIIAREVAELFVDIYADEFANFNRHAFPEIEKVIRSLGHRGKFERVMYSTTSDHRRRSVGSVWWIMVCKRCGEQLFIRRDGIGTCKEYTLTLVTNGITTIVVEMSVGWNGIQFSVREHPGRARHHALVVCKKFQVMA